MKTIPFAFIFLVAVQLCYGQPAKVENELKKYQVDSAAIARLHEELRNSKEDTARVLAMELLIRQYSNKLDSALYYGFEALSLSRKINFHKGELNALAQLQNELKHHGVLLKAFNICHKGLQASRKYRDKSYEATFLGDLGILYRESGVFPEAMNNLRKSRNLYDSIGEEFLSAYQLSNIGEVYLLRNDLDSALSSCRIAFKKLKRAPIEDFWIRFYVSLNLGNIFMAQANYDSSLYYLRGAKKIAGYLAHRFNTNLSIAKIFDKLGMEDSTLFYATEANRVAVESEVYSFNADINDFLGRFYYKEDIAKSTKFTRRALAYKDSLYRQNVIIALENFDELDEQERQFEIQSAQAAYQFKTRLIGLLSGVFVLLIIMAMLVRNYRQKQRSIILLNKQKDEINNAKEKTETALSDLQATQSQLIQSEKMASLGELTAGIAHEIQNPLNFINNFSEVNMELIDDLRKELASDNKQSAEEIANNIKGNQEKINHHGKRADGIVKSMLQHSRTSSGHKEPIDINALCEEYLRLAYHGFRAKDKTFNANVESNFDLTLPKVDVVPQDIGRVVLNLISNAFYAVNEKNKVSKAAHNPTVKLTTRKANGAIEILIEDNGGGIPESIKEKIFQPFFTTKPTGQGTGLGLSLAYDMVAKGHGGELKMETKEGEGCKFIILLPLPKKA